MGEDQGGTEEAAGAAPGGLAGAGTSGDSEGSAPHMLGQMFAQEEERGDIPPPGLQWIRTRTRTVITRDRTYQDFRNGAKEVRASKYEDVKAQLMETAEEAQKGVGLRRVPGWAKPPVPVTVEEKVRELRREVEKTRRKGRGEE